MAPGMGHYLRGSSMRGNWRKGPFNGAPKDMLSKALEMGVCFHKGPAFGEHGGTFLAKGL